MIGDDIRSKLRNGNRGQSGIVETIGRLIVVLVENVGVISREQAIWILDPLKDKAESEERKSEILN